jgi:hypothetical protein
VENKQLKSNWKRKANRGETIFPKAFFQKKWEFVLRSKEKGYFKNNYFLENKTITLLCSPCSLQLPLIA